MTSELIIDAINRVEIEFDVWEIKYGNTPIWPILRLDLFNFYSDHFQPNKPEQKAKQATRFNNVISKFTKLYWFIKRFYNEFSTDQKRFKYNDSIRPRPNHHVDYLVYGLSSHRSVSIKGKYFNRITDSIDFFLKKSGSTFHIESVMEPAPYIRYSNSKIINKDLIKYDFLGKIYNCIVGKKTSIIGLAKFISYLNKNHIKHEFEEKNLIERCEKIVSYSNYFKKIIRQLQPKLIFLDIYYHDRAMALILAAKQLNIPTIELQHGLQGKHHHAYGRWNNLPQTGTPFFPDFFWVWDENSCKNIKAWSFNNIPFPLVAGNTFISCIKNNLVQLTIPDTFYLKIKSHRYNILITLAASTENECFYLKIIAQLIQQLPKNIHWIFRCHPGHIELNENALNQILKDVPKENITIQKPFEVDVYGLFSHINLHLTYASTVCLEASSFQLPSVIVGKMGYLHFRTYIDAGIFYYAETLEELSSIINKRLYSKPEKTTPVLLSDTSLIYDQVKFLLSYKNNSVNG